MKKLLLKSMSLLTDAAVWAMFAAFWLIVAGAVVMAVKRI
jgi:hypothetical protein